MKKIMVCLVALVITLAFDAYKAHEKQVQKDRNSWEEKVAQAVANRYSIEELMTSSGAKYEQALALKLQEMPDNDFRCLVDSLIRGGYSRRDEQVILANFDKNVRGRDVAFFEVKENLSPELVIAQEIAARPSKAGKEEVANWFSRSLNGKNPWQISRELALTGELIKSGEFTKEEVGTFATMFSAAIKNAGGAEYFALANSEAGHLFKKGEYVFEKKGLGDLNQASTEDLASFINNWGEDYHLYQFIDREFVYKVVAELKTRQLTPKEVLQLADFK